MASISLDRTNGSRRILFVNKAGQRKAIRLGRMTKRDAESFKIRLEALLSANMIGNSPDRDTSRWLSELPDDLHAKLLTHGLAEPRQLKSVPMLIVFVDADIAKRTDTKPATVIVYKRCRNLLASFFEGKRLDEITVANAKDFVRWITTKERPLSQNTARRMTGFARQFLNDAVDAELLVKNPFKSRDIKVAVRGDANGFHFLTVADTAKLIDACPDAQWRLIVALSTATQHRTCELTSTAS